MEKMMPMIMMLIIVIIAFVYAMQGIKMHNQVAVEEVKLHQLQDSYFSQSKVVRDGAEAGSQLNKDLVKIQQYPSTLLELKLVGVGKILTGIFALLLGILMALVMMPVRLSRLMRERK